MTPSSRLLWRCGRARGAFEEVHVCLRSKIVATGVQLANLALNGVVQVHAGRARLEVEMRRVLRASTDAIKV